MGLLEDARVRLFDFQQLVGVPRVFARTFLSDHRGVLRAPGTQPEALRGGRNQDSPFRFGRPPRPDSFKRLLDGLRQVICALDCHPALKSRAGTAWSCYFLPSWCSRKNAHITLLALMSCVVRPTNLC